MAVTYFGEGEYLGKAQCNHAAQNLGLRGRTIHSANGLLMSDSLQTARLCLNPQAQKKLDRLAGTAGVDEACGVLWCYSAWRPALHATGHGSLLPI